MFVQPYVGLISRRIITWILSMRCFLSLCHTCPYRSFLYSPLLCHVARPAFPRQTPSETLARHQRLNNHFDSQRPRLDKVQERYLPMMLSTWRMRCRHFDFFGQLEETSAPVKHLVDVILWYPMIDQVREAHIAARSVKAFADLSRLLDSLSM